MRKMRAVDHFGEIRYNRSVWDKPFMFFTVAFMAVFTLICIYPFYYLIINSISANDVSALGKIMFVPQGIHFKNYAEVFKLGGLWQAMKISVLRTVIGTVFTLLGCTFVGFMFTQEKMTMRKFWYRFTVATMYFNAGIIPWYLTMKQLALTDNFMAYILPAIISPFNIILIKTYIESIPKAVQEAAEIDGAGIFQIFSIIILPLCKPIMATIAVFAAVNQWNSFQDTLLLMTKPKLYTLQFTLYQYINQANSLAAMMKNGGLGATSAAISAAQAQTATSVRMTVSVFVVIPVMLIYPFFQRFFIKGVMIGSVKG